MKVLQTNQSREEYFEIQIKRSKQKFLYNKVSILDTINYFNIIHKDSFFKGKMVTGPILCLGTRNGREVDLFRIAFFGKRLIKFLVKIFERNHPFFYSLVPQLESINRSDISDITPNSVFGVEINPQGKRSDIYIGSFDNMPSEWEHKFGVIYSNSFDQSFNPYETAKEWKRILRNGGYLIFGFAKDAEPTITDPVTNLGPNDFSTLFDGELIYFRE